MFAGPSDFGRSEELSATYRRLITARPFLESVELNGASISATTSQAPPVVIVTASHSSPNIVAEVAQRTAEQFIDHAIETRLAEIASLQSAAAAQGITDFQSGVAAQFTAVDSLSLLEPVLPPSRPVVPKTRRNIQIGALIGLALAIAASAALENLRDTVRLPDQLERRFGVTGLGTMFMWSPKELQGTSVVMAEAPSSSFSETFRQIRANIEFATATQTLETLLVSSANTSEGKSTVISNLAVAFAQAGKQVLLVDADLRRPTLHKIFKLADRTPGLSNLLADQGLDLDDVVKHTNVEGVSLIPSGPTPPNPAELIGSARMTQLLDKMKTTYDLILVDSPPMLPVADGSIIASRVDGMVIVVDGFRTRSSALQATLDTVGATQVKLVGVIINKLKRPRIASGYGHQYYAYYRSYSEHYGPEEELSADEANRGLMRIARKAKRALPFGKS